MDQLYCVSIIIAKEGIELSAFACRTQSVLSKLLVLEANPCGLVKVLGYGEVYEKYLLCGITDFPKDI